MGLDIPLWLMRQYIAFETNLEKQSLGAGNHVIACSDQINGGSLMAILTDLVEEDVRTLNQMFLLLSI